MDVRENLKNFRESQSYFLKNTHLSVLDWSKNQNLDNSQKFHWNSFLFDKFKVSLLAFCRDLLKFMFKISDAVRNHSCQIDLLAVGRFILLISCRILIFLIGRLIQWSTEVFYLIFVISMFSIQKNRFVFSMSMGIWWGKSPGRQLT